LIFWIASAAVVVRPSVVACGTTNVVDWIVPPAPVV
jgi:hypothetical protein